MNTKILLMVIGVLFLQDVYMKSKRISNIKSYQKNKTEIKEHIQEVFSLDNINKVMTAGQQTFDSTPMSKEKIFDIARTLAAGTPEGQMIDKIDTLLQPNEIDAIRDAMQKEYDKRKLQQAVNPILDQLNNFQIILLQIINQYLEAVSDIKNEKKKIKNNIDLKSTIIYFKNIFEDKRIEHDLADIDFLIDLYCILDQEDDLYKKAQGAKFLSDISFNEDYYRIENYISK